MANTNLDQSIDIEQNIFYSKEEITEITGLSIHTLNNWVKEYKPEENEIETGRQNRRAYSTQYLVRIFKEVKRDDLISLVRNYQQLGQDGLKPNQEPTKDEAKPSNFDLILVAKDETIKELKARVESLETELREKNQQIRANQDLLKNQQTLGLQQNQLLLDTKKDKPRGFLTWFGMGGGKKNETEPEA